MFQKQCFQQHYICCTANGNFSQVRDASSKLQWQCTEKFRSEVEPDGERNYKVWRQLYIMTWNLLHNQERVIVVKSSLYCNYAEHHTLWLKENFIYGTTLYSRLDVNCCFRSLFVCYTVLKPQKRQYETVTIPVFWPIRTAVVFPDHLYALWRFENTAYILRSKFEYSSPYLRGLSMRLMRCPWNDCSIWKFFGRTEIKHVWSTLNTLLPNCKTSLISLMCKISLIDITRSDWTWCNLSRGSMVFKKAFDNESLCNNLAEHLSQRVW